MADIEAMKKAFVQKVNRHDVTFAYSDDNSVWRRGQGEKDEIDFLAKQLPLEFVTEVWNKRMDAYFTASEAPRWYWKG